MRLTRLALPAALAAATVTMATFASPAFADDPAAARIYPVSGDVMFASATSGAITIDYSCPTSDAADAPGTSLSVDLSQHGTGGDPAATASGSTDATCDGSSRDALVELTLSGGAGVLSGAATLHATLGT